MRNLLNIGLILLFLDLSWIPSHAQAVDPSCSGPDIKPGITCPGEETDPAAAVNTPSAYAWTVFAEINQPAFPGDQKDTRRVWETWKNPHDHEDSRYAIYLEKGTAPQKWHVSPEGALPDKRLLPIRKLALLRQQSRELRSSRLGFGRGEGEEVRTNRPAFNYILENELYNREGQYRFASVNQNFDFPIASKEVKAVWLEAESANPDDYYSANYNGKRYILVAMHIITKDIPFWFWTSWVHKHQDQDGPTPLADYQIVPPSLRGTPFENYRLLAELVQTPQGKLVPTGKGAQVDWITRTGESTVMGNPQIEIGFEEESSCITCHSLASIGLRKRDLQYNEFFPLVIGPVPPGKFLKDGVTYFPLDFLWSLRNAKSLRH